MASTESSPFFNNPSTETDLKSKRLSQGRGVIRLNKVLTPVDFSPNSEKAVDYGLRLAQLTRASVLSLHVFELPEFSGCLPEAGSLQGDYLEIKKIFDAAVAKARERLAEVAQRTREAEVEVRTEIRQGTPYEEIVKVAKAEEVELIVIATHGYTGFKHFLLGSTAERGRAHSPLPGPCGSRKGTRFCFVEHFKVFLRSAFL